LQFAVAIGLGIAAIVVFEQIEFARHTDLGFRRNNVVVVRTAGQLSQAGMESFASALSQGQGILGVARSDAIAFSGDNQTLTTQKPGDPEVLSPTHLAITPNYFELYGIKILAGRALSDQRAEDVFTWGAGDTTTPKNEGHNVMVNADLAHALGYTPQDIVGRNFIFGQAHMKVVGVAADTLVNGVRSTGLQTVYVYAPDVSDRFSIRIEPGRTREAMAYISRISRAFLPNIAAAPAFLDDSYERLYTADEKQGQIFAIFVAIAIFIACMGLFGLAAFTAGRRTKEIGIRKVFGASVRDVTLLLLWQFSLPVLIANAVAWPLVWHYLHGWLQGFAYRISLNPLYFLGSGAVAMMVAWATVFVHARRVASANPIHALRYE
jgi:putative ABC transport system permease protein